MGFFKWLFGSKEDISQSAMKHSTVGEFNTKNRLVSGGHSQKNIDELKKRGQAFNIEKTYANGVRVGNVPNHKDKNKKSGITQSWFPKSWSDGKIKRAGQTIARGTKENDGKTKFGHYSSVNAGVIRTNGEIKTIFPMNVQKNKKGGEIHERRKTSRTSRKK